MTSEDLLKEHRDYLLRMGISEKQLNYIVSYCSIDLYLMFPKTVMRSFMLVAFAFIDEQNKKDWKKIIEISKRAAEEARIRRTVFKHLIPPKYLNSYKAIINHSFKRLDKLYNKGHRLRAYERVVVE